MNERIRGHLALGYLSLSVVLGGASAAGAIANAFLQLVAVLIILALMWSGRHGLQPEARLLAWTIALYLAWVLLSLVPLPPGLWQSLPMRSDIAEGLRLLGLAGTSLPLTLAPAATLASVLWLLPPAAMFLLVISLPWEKRQPLYVAVVVLAVLSITLGVFQLAGGPNSPLRFYEITNDGSPVGFFANINHQATLILCGLPAAAAMASRFATRSDASKRSGGLIIAGSFALYLTAGIAVAGSMAGYGLFLPAAFASLLIYRRATRGPLGAIWKAGMAVVAVLFVVLALFGPVSQETLSEKFSEDPSSRRVFAATTVEAIGNSFPAGTGLGTFANVYRLHEDPSQATRAFVNHAHNDYLELVLELGAVAILLIGLFILWWLRRSLDVWRSEVPGTRLARAGTVIIGVVLLHSLVDYPLRTSAMAAVFAVACALLVPPRVRRRRGDVGEQDAAEPVRHLEV